MTIIATDTTRFSAVVKREYDPASGFCRDALIVNDAAATLNVGSVLGAYIASPAGVASPAVGTGNGTAGSITITSTQYLRLGAYNIVFTSQTAFSLFDPKARLVGTGTVGNAYSLNGVAFTVTAGSTPFVAGDVITLTVSGTTKARLMVSTAVDGSQNVVGVLVADVIGLSHPTVIPAATDTKVLALTRGPVILDKAALYFDPSVNAAQLVIAYAQLKELGLIPETQV